MSKLKHNNPRRGGYRNVTVANNPGNTNTEKTPALTAEQIRRVKEMDWGKGVKKHD